MQLGTRWSVGATPPPRLSDDFTTAIAQVEAGLEGDTSNLRWTLTWLEGHPIADLDPSTSSGQATVVREDYDGTVVVTLED